MEKVGFALILTILIASAPVFGQEKGTFEVGAFGKAAFFDNSLNYDAAFGGGIRVGYYFFRNLMFEADGALAAPNDQPLGKSNYWPIHGRLIYAFPLTEKFSLLGGGGYTHNAWGKALSGNEDGYGALAGLRWNLSENWGIRVDGIGDYIPSPVNGADHNWDWGIQAGVSFLLPVGGPKDSDGDGVLDANDRCPDTPKGTKVDDTGCPLPLDSDGDGDGVLDANDRCPDTPKGVKVDDTGCPRTVTLEGVNFATNSDELTTDSKTILDSVAKSLTENPNLQVEIAGHTDNTGSRAYNLRLSQKRAESVRNYLISKGVSPENMNAKGYGPDQPVAGNDTTQGRAQNRRVEMRRLN